jgi:hypothetical protein
MTHKPTDTSADAPAEAAGDSHTLIAVTPMVLLLVAASALADAATLAALSLGLLALLLAAAALVAWRA